MERDEIDSNLIDACVKGEKEAWDKLAERASGFVYFCIHKVSGSSGKRISDEDVSDIYQSVFLSLCKDNFRKLRSYRGKCKFTTWLSFVVRSACVDYLRKEKFKAGSTVSLEEPLGPREKQKGFIAVKDTLAYNGRDAVSQIEKKEAQEMVQSVLKELPPRERMIIRLFYAEGKKYREIAEIMDIPINTVSSAMSRAKGILRESLCRK